MLLNVSRTPAPDSWLSNLATEPPSYSALDKDTFVTLEKSRFSISTIDSELFPELLSWSALMNALPHSLTQNIPSDITKPDTDTLPETVTIHHETNTIHDVENDTVTVNEAKLLLSSILDPTTLEAGFDQSCFDGLDDLVTHDPFEAFADICWLDAVGYNESAPTMRVTTPTQLLNKPTGRRKLPSLTVTTLKERDGDVCKNRTYTDYDEDPVSPSDIRIDITSSASQCPERNLLRSKRNTKVSTFSDDDEATSFVIFEAPVLAPHRYDSVGHYPIPSSRPRNVVSNRIATFCSNLPAPFSPVI